MAAGIALLVLIGGITVIGSGNKTPHAASPGTGTSTSDTTANTGSTGNTGTATTLQTIPPATEAPQTTLAPQTAPAGSPPDTSPPATSPPDTSPPDTAPPDTSPPDTSPPTTAAPGPLPQQPAGPFALSGSGQTTTQAFPVAGGLTLFAAQCSCQSYFTVEIEDASGQLVDAPVNVVGNYSGVVAEGLPAGNYMLNVYADTTWTVTVSQPRDLPGADLPQTYSETGQQVVGPFAANGSVRIQAENTSLAGGRFSLTILNSDGAVQDVPVSELGSYSGLAISGTLNGGPYWLEVNSDGAWSVAVTNP